MSEKPPWRSKPFAEDSDEELANDADMGQRGQGSLVEMMRRLRVSVEILDRNISYLRGDIKRGQKVETRLTRVIIALTIVIAFLTAVMAAPILISVWNRFMAGS